MPEISLRNTSNTERQAYHKRIRQLTHTRTDCGYKRRWVCLLAAPICGLFTRLSSGVFDADPVPIRHRFAVCMDVLELFETEGYS